VEPTTEVRMPAFAQVAMVTRMGGIDGDTHSRAHILHATADRFDDAGKLVSENEG
jgi:hypothetical protein